MFRSTSFSQRILIILGIILVLLFQSTAEGNPIVLDSGSSGSPLPEDNNDLQFRSEEIDFFVDDKITVHARYTFYNPTDLTINAQILLPITGYDKYSPKNITISVDRMEIDHTINALPRDFFSRYSSFLWSDLSSASFNLTVGPVDERTVHVRYDRRFKTSFSYDDMPVWRSHWFYDSLPISSGTRFNSIRYISHTAVYWNNTIDLAVFNFHIDKRWLDGNQTFKFRNVPPNWKMIGSNERNTTYQIRIEDWSSNFNDIFIRWNQYRTTDGKVRYNLAETSLTIALPLILVLNVLYHRRRMRRACLALEKRREQILQKSERIAGKK